MISVCQKKYCQSSKKYFVWLKIYQHFISFIFFAEPLKYKTLSEISDVYRMSSNKPAILKFFFNKSMLMQGVQRPII